jgi:hypothetical protein
MTLAEWTAICGIVFGTAGLVTGTVSLIISLLNYRRDRAKIVVSLQWDAETRKGRQNKIEESWCHIYITNKGRRPAYITFVGLEYPNQNTIINLLTDGLNPIGQQLLEGDAPLQIKVPQHSDLKQYSQNWRKIRAIATDSLGKEYKSKKADSKPSWAT